MNEHDRYGALFVCLFVYLFPEPYPTAHSNALRIYESYLLFIVVNLSWFYRVYPFNRAYVIWNHHWAVGLT